MSMAAETHEAVSTTIAGLTVERVLSRVPGRYTLVEAASPQGKRVALKLFADPLAADPELRGRLLRLADLGDALAHPLLPVLGALDLGDGRTALVHPVPQGRTLAELLRNGPLERTEAIGILSQVAGALETAHALGLPTDELTPEDVFVTNGRPRQATLVAFGVRTPTRRGCEAIAGVDYRSPEEIGGRPRERASAVYGLACLLVECLTGAPPYPYDRPLLTLQAHRVEAPPEISARRKGLPKEIDAVVASGLNKQPEQRYASPARLMRAAQKAIGVKAPIPVAPAPRRPVHEPVSRRPAVEPAPRRPAPAPVPRRPAERTAAADARAGAQTPDRSSRRGARPPRDSRRSRRRLAAWPAPVSIGAGLVVLMSTAGFALGQSGGTSPPRAPATVASNEAASLNQRTTYVGAVDTAVRRLSEQRATERRRLRNARRPAAQAAAAAALADAYGQAQRALPGAALEVPGSGHLPDRLRAAESAYRWLASAAQGGDARAYRAARAAVQRRELEVSNVLTSLSYA
jgi:serine/threonine kinase PknH